MISSLRKRRRHYRVIGFFSSFSRSFVLRRGRPRRPSLHPALITDCGCAIINGVAPDDKNTRGFFWCWRLAKLCGHALVWEATRDERSEASLSFAMLRGGWGAWTRDEITRIDWRRPRLFPSRSPATWRSVTLFAAMSFLHEQMIILNLLATSNGFRLGVLMSLCNRDFDIEFCSPPPPPPDSFPSGHCLRRRLC